MPAAKQPSIFILFHQNKIQCRDNHVFPRIFLKCRGGNRTLRSELECEYRNERGCIFLSCGCTYLLFSSAILMTTDCARCTCVFLPFPWLAQLKNAGIFLLLFSLSAMSKMPHVNASLFSQVKRKKNKNNKTRIGIRAGLCLQQQPGSRDIVLPVRSKSELGDIS